MKNYRCWLVLIILVTACKSKHKSESNSDLPAAMESAYKHINLPFYAVDSSMQDKAPAASISLQTFTTYIPDTIFNSAFGKDRNIELKPVGKIEQGGKESYFITLAEGKKQSVLYLSVYDSNHHIVSMPVVVNSNTDTGEVTNSVSIDKKLTIVVNKEWVVKNDSYYKRIIYAYNNVGVFTAVLTETNEQQRSQDAIVNSLDTFPKRNKFSGDYNKGATSYLFIRDGSAVNEYLFFVHFQTGKKDEPCGGELRGRFKMTDETTGQYTNTGDPCGMSFIFKNNEVQVKENGSCGNYRDIKCFFNDTYTKTKEAAKRKR